MGSCYTLTLTQTKILQSLAETPELTANELAVQTRSLPSRLAPAVAELEHMGLVSSSQQGADPNQEQVVHLAPEGHTVARVLAQFRGTPPVGSVVPLPSGSFGPLSSLGSFLTGRKKSGSPGSSRAAHVLVAADRTDG